MHQPLLGVSLLPEPQLWVEQERWALFQICLKLLCVFFFNTEFNNVILASLELAIEQAGTTEGHMPLPPKCQD